jgi:hypothetical protein
MCHDNANALTRRRIIQSAGILGGLTLTGLLASQIVSPWARRGCSPAGNPSHIDTSSHYDTTWYGEVYLTSGNTASNYDQLGEDIPEGPKELVIYIHGWRNNKKCGLERIEQIKTSYDSVGYRHPIVGLTWGAGYSWNNSKEIARLNASKLANFITDFKQLNPDTIIRVHCYSLGVLVGAETVFLLNENHYSNVITTLVLLGGAIPAKSVSITGKYGPAIKNATKHTENFWMNNDKTLTRIFTLLEDQKALGTNGCVGEPPTNYTDHEIKLEIEHGEVGESIPITKQVIETYGK